MSKTVSINEDGTTKTFTDVNFLNTKQVSGAAVDWMPDDETQVGEITITANGEYVPYEHELYGFQKVTVNVSGGAGAEIDVNGTETFVTPYPATGAGSSIMGIDPTDGSLYRMEVQEIDGVLTLVKSKVADDPSDYIPSAIAILVNPFKLEYADGEDIDYNGLVVQLMDDDGYVYTDGTYPSGTITWTSGGSDISTTVVKAEYSEGSTQDIPVSWTSPYDSETYYASFEITVTSGESS